MIVPRELSQKGKSQILRRGRVLTYRFGYSAAELPWNANFVDSGRLVLNALEAHVSKQMTDLHTYDASAPLSSRLEWESHASSTNSPRIIT